MEQVYVVTMYRWGDRDNHSYVVGAYTTEEKATEAGLQEEQCRGGKYAHEIVSCRIDQLWDMDNRPQIIYAADSFWGKLAQDVDKAVKE